MPELNETAKKIAQGHEILLIEGSTEGDEEMGRIKLQIEQRIEEINQNIIASKAQADSLVEPKPQTKSFFGKLMGKK